MDPFNLVGCLDSNFHFGNVHNFTDSDGQVRTLLLTHAHTPGFHFDGTKRQKKRTKLKDVEGVFHTFYLLFASSPPVAGNFVRNPFLKMATTSVVILCST